MEKAYLKPREAANYLGIALSTLYLWKSNRRLRFTTIDKVVRFKVTYLDKFMAENAREPR